MNSIAYLKRQYELTQNIIFLHIAAYIERLEKELEELKK